MFKSIIFYAMLAQGSDISSTAVGLNRGCAELTHPMKSTVGIALMKGGASVSFAFMYKGAKEEHPKIAKGLAWALIGSGAAATVWNLTQIPRCGR
jgi:hypothetical protein